MSGGISMYTFEESDWKLFKKLLPVWQERFLEKAIENYNNILNEDDLPSKKFWKLSNKMTKDKKSPGIILHDVKRDEMHAHILDLLVSRVITESDLEGFSEPLKVSVKRWRMHILRVDPQ